jgi:hypothetical protein
MAALTAGRTPVVAEAPEPAAARAEETAAVR